MILTGKTLVVTGVANKNSIAAAIARSFSTHGGKIVLAYQNERIRSRVEGVAEECGDAVLGLVECDVGSDESIAECAQASANLTGGHCDGLVHAIGFAPRNEISGDYLDSTTREGFSTALDISAYSLVALAKAFRSQFTETAAVTTLTYHGSQQSVPNYNTMGIAKAALESAVRYLAATLGPAGVRVNGVSAGPIRTLASAGVGDFRAMLSIASRRAALRRNVDQAEVAEAVSFLHSNMSSGITGETLYVDAGFQSAAMSSDEFAIHNKA